jgi:hypothetical protein
MLNGRSPLTNTATGESGTTQMNGSHSSPSDIDVEGNGSVLNGSTHVGNRKMLPCTAQEQRRVLLEAESAPLVLGTNMFLLSTLWWQRWKRFCEGDDSQGPPGPVDNSNLFQDEASGVLKVALVDNQDYILVPEDIWDRLTSWYIASDFCNNAHPLICLIILLFTYKNDNVMIILIS